VFSVRSLRARALEGVLAALRHGFTAETVIEPLEHLEEYRAFESVIVSEYLPQMPVEQELIHSPASLFWRLPWATAIETGLFRMQGEILRSFQSSRQKHVRAQRREGIPSALSEADCACPQELFTDANSGDELAPIGGACPYSSARIAFSYQRRANLDNELIDRLGRYEAGLWRPLQTLKRR
jgi:hypothetical protein